MVTIDFKLTDVKLESSDALLLKLGEKSVVGFQSYLHLLLKCSFKYKLISPTFYTCKKINNIFLKFHHSLLWMPTKSVKSFTAERRDSKKKTNAHKNRFGTPLI